MVSPWLGIGPRTYVLQLFQKTTSLILRRKLGDPLTGGDQPVSSQYSLTDHKKTLTFLIESTSVLILSKYFL